MGCALVQPPQAYWKKSSQGETAGSTEAASMPAGSAGVGACAPLPIAEVTVIAGAATPAGTCAAS